MAAPTLLPYQTKWIRDPAGFAVMEKSRRIGISWAEALGAVRHSARKRSPGNVYYQSYAKDMTAGFIGDAAEWAEKVQGAAAAVGEEAFEEAGRAAWRYRIESRTGKEIVAMTSSPRAFRSKGRPGDRAIIDEAAFVDDLGAVLKAARAFRIWGGQVRLLSTHNGESSPFRTLCDGIREGRIPGSLHKVTFADAVEQGLYRKICDVTSTPWTPEAQEEWVAEVRAEYGDDAAEELDCVPASGAGHWLSWPLIHGAEHEDAGLPDLYNFGITYLGVDVARRRDLFVIVALELVGDVLWVREIVELRRASFAEQDAVLDEMVKRYRPLRIGMDQTGMGEKPVEDAKAAHGEMRVEGVLMTGPRRLDLATALREPFEDARLRIPRSDALRADLRSVRVEDGPMGAPRLIVPRIADADGEKSHADRFWALALAAGAAASGLVEYGYTGAGAGRGRHDGMMSGLLGRGGFGRGAW